MADLLAVACVYRPHLTTARRFRRQQGWLIQLAHALRLEDETGQRRKTRQVKRAVGAFLDQLVQATATHPEEQPVIHHLQQTLKKRWWGLFTCFRISGLPATNNAHELFFNQLKQHQRRIQGHKSVHAFIVRYGVYAAYLDPRETFEQLLARLTQVSNADFQAARQAWRENEAALHKVFRFRHDRANFLKDLERAWNNLPHRSTRRK